MLFQESEWEKEGYSGVPNKRDGCKLKGIPIKVLDGWNDLEYCINIKLVGRKL